MGLFRSGFIRFFPQATLSPYSPFEGLLLVFPFSVSLVPFACLSDASHRFFQSLVRIGFCSSGRVTQVVHLQGWFPILHTASVCFGHSVTYEVQSAVFLS